MITCGTEQYRKMSTFLHNYRKKSVQMGHFLLKNNSAIGTLNIRSSTIEHNLSLKVTPLTQTQTLRIKGLK
jgi:hypothetical protein